MFGASQFMFTGGRCRTLQARRSGLRGGKFSLDRHWDRRMHRLLQTFDDRIRSREIHGGPNFAGRVANRVGARHCVGGYSHWRRLTRHAERMDWPA